MKFYLNQESFAQFRNQILLKVTPLLLLPIVFVLYFNRPDATTLPIMVVLFGATVGYSLFTTIKRQKQAWQTFELKIEGDLIERSQANHPLISLSKHDIVEALENSNGSIMIVARKKADSIFIPNGVESKAELLDAISQITVVRGARQKNYLWLTYLSSIVTILLLIVFMGSSALPVIVGSGTVLLAVLIWGFIEVQRNKNYDKWVKRSSYGVIILVLVIFSKIFIVWSGYNS